MVRVHINFFYSNVMYSFYKHVLYSKGASTHSLNTLVTFNAFYYEYYEAGSVLCHKGASAQAEFTIEHFPCGETCT